MLNIWPLAQRYETCVQGLSPSALEMQTKSEHPADSSSVDPKIIRVAIGIVIKGKTLLICQRKPTAVLGGYWEFPGGKVEPNESDEAAVLRELREELGIVTEIIAALPPIVHTYPHGTVRLQPFFCKLIAGTPAAVDCAAWKWVALPELCDYPFPPANAGLLQRLETDPLLQSAPK